MSRKASGSRLSGAHKLQPHWNDWQPRLVLCSGELVITRRLRAGLLPGVRGGEMCLLTTLRSHNDHSVLYVVMVPLRLAPCLACS
ncbi:hypothetical protein EYF80_067043 [Liparis tanakae]|uniref:Uncharacterized protein n=1 Tax=Liparis tanakae TaxID=230148 RepID=A0A4Z2E2S8_9TELE|nr:hypothetical protein EYF80_067043 [Liparis tanakae]